MERRIVDWSGMRALLAVALALLLPAAAQAAGAAPSPPKDATAGVEQVYTDYSGDGTVSECDHTRADLQAAYDTMTPEVADDFPDFRDQVKTAVDQHKAGKCPNQDQASAAPTTAPPPAASPAGTPESGKLPETQPSGPGAVPPAETVTPIPTATVPPVAPAATAAAPTPAPTPVIAHEGHRSIAIPAILIALALLGAGVLAFSAYAGRRRPGVRHAWREAAFRTRGTWADFSDWLRLGR
jgi:hypothetical protein